MTGNKVFIVASYMEDVTLKVAQFPRPGETVIMLNSLRTAGGKGSNQAIQAALCGAEVALIASVGRDAAGAAARKIWSEHRIETSAVQESVHLETGAAFILVDGEGQNQIVINPGANACLSADAVEAAGSRVAAADIVVAQMETPLSATLTAFRIARRHGRATLLNAAPFIPGFSTAILPLTDVLVLNELEARQLAGTDDGMPLESTISTIMAGFAGHLVVTLGSRGACLVTPDGCRLDQSALQLDVIDTTGAGDAFTGAFAARWAATGDRSEALRWGTTAGSLACRRRGASGSFARGQEIEEQVLLST